MTRYQDEVTMIKQGYKRKIRPELAAGLTSADETSRREGAYATTLCKQRDTAINSQTGPDETKLIEMRKHLEKIKETVSELALAVHKMKKTQK
jgi:hypothetical protein